jgi:hypothetical protein
MEELEFNWEKIELPDSTGKRIARSKLNGVIQIECRIDKNGREIEKLFYDDDGQLRERTIYEHDSQDRRPKVTTSFDKNGKLIFRHERGKRPELFE